MPKAFERFSSASSTAPFYPVSKFLQVEIPNLESLSVEQIQELQKFVEQRKGLFDFESYSFVIQKRLDLNGFVKLLESLGIEADVEERFVERKKVPRVSFGQYKGLLFSELPDSYLLWLKNNYKGYQRKFVEEELKSRNL